MADERKAVVVIGAGLTGLTCAYRLKKLGIDVALLEKSDRPGGVISSESINGYLIERGPNSMRGTVEMLDLIDELGIGEELIEGDRHAPAFIYYKGKLQPVPAGPGPFIKTGLISFGAKLRLLTEPFRKTRQSQDEESIASFVNRRLGPQITERFIAPFTAGIYAGDAELLGIEAAFPSLVRLEKEHGSLFKGALNGISKARNNKTKRKPGEKPRRTKRLVSFRDGMAVLPRALAEKLGEDFITECSELKVEFRSALNGSQGFDVRFNRSGREQTLSADQIVIGIPAFATAEIVRPASEELVGLLDSIEYPPLAIVYLSYDRASIPINVNGFGFLAVPNQGLRILGCVYTSSLFEGRAPEDKVLFTVFVGGVRDPEGARLKDAEIASIANQDIKKALSIEDDAELVGITKYDRAIPQYNVGHVARIRRVEEIVSTLPGLTLTGNWMHGVATGNCIEDAEKIARLISGSGS